MAGALIVLDSLRVQPDSIYWVQWSAFMIFMVVIGGLGTIEGPILGAVVYASSIGSSALDLGTWCSRRGRDRGRAAAPRGLWGLAGRFRLFPVGYRLVLPPAGSPPSGSCTSDQCQTTRSSASRN